MAYKRYLVEFGMGTDLHGMDVTKAARKAVKDAISHCCLCGLQEILELSDTSRHMRVEIKLCSPKPDEVDLEKVASTVPFGETNISVEEGGGSARGLYVASLGNGDSIVIVIAFLTVWINV